MTNLSIVIGTFPYDREDGQWYRMTRDAVDRIGWASKREVALLDHILYLQELVAVVRSDSMKK